MLDFSAVAEKRLTLAELVTGLTCQDLRELTNEMIDAMLALLSGCDDVDVQFVPVDPTADDPYTDRPDEVASAWTLGHVIVHTTASAEESAALAAELGRGVVRSGRSRAEVPWQSMTTIAQCRARLEESRRMRLAALAMWPDLPHLENSYESSSGVAINCVGRFVLGLRHDDSHLAQLADIVRQAHAARRSV